MNETVTDRLGGLAWSEDPLGRDLAALRIDVEGAAPQSLSIPRRGPISFTQFGDAESLTAVRAALLEAETTFDGPVTLRWHVDGDGRIDIADTRLIDEPLPWGSGPGHGMPQQPHELDRWSRANAGEVIPNVLTPLSWSVISDALDRGFHAPWGEWTTDRRFVAMYDGYVYFNVGLIMELLQERLGLSTIHFLEAVGGPEAADAQLGDGDFSSIRWSRMLRQLPFLLRSLRDQDQIPKRWPAQRAAAEAERDRLQALDTAAMSDRDIFRALTRSAGESERQTIFLMYAQSAVYSAVQALLWVTDRWLGSNRRELALSVLQGLPGIRTQEGNIALRRIAQRAARDDEAAAFISVEDAQSLWPAVQSERLPESLAWLRDELNAFLSEYGHRAAGELEAAEPRWVERPELILDTFRDYVLQPQSNDPDELLERQQAAARKAEQEIRDQLLSGSRWGRARWLLVRAQIQQARRLQPLRENPKFTLLELSLQQRRLWRVLADRWIERGVIDAHDDVYYLLFDELATLSRRSSDPVVGARMRSRIRRRRRQYDRWSRTPAPPLRDRLGEPINTAEPEAPMTPASAAAGDTELRDAPEHISSDESEALPLTLRGIPASTGQASGYAHVADSPTVGREISQGQILVARFTDPGWTPIFPLASAVVTEIGGVLSHGAIVAREFGIPAVVNVQQVTERIQSGDRLHVNGATGQVTILERRA